MARKSQKAERMGNAMAQWRNGFVGWDSRSVSVGRCRRWDFCKSLMVMQDIMVKCNEWHAAEKRRARE